MARTKPARPDACRKAAPNHWGLFQVDMAHRADFSGRLRAFVSQLRRQRHWPDRELAGGFSDLSGRAAMARAAFF